MEDFRKLLEQLEHTRESLTWASKITEPFKEDFAFTKPYIPPSEAELVVEAIGEEVERWKAETPEGKHLVILLGTPDGGTMDVEGFQSFGRFSYRAIGYVSGELNMVVGHVATLAFRGFYEDNAKGSRHAGFKAFIQSQQTNAPQQPDNK